MSFLGGMAGGVASEAAARKKKKSADDKSDNKPDFKNSPIGKLGSKIKKTIQSFKKGGKVKKTGKALLHKGEKVVPKRSGKKR